MNEVSPDFKAIMLLLSAALGQSLIIERVLEAVNGLIKKVLLREDSPFAVKAPPTELVVAELGFEKINSLLDDKVEELEELRLQHASAAESEQKEIDEKIAGIEQATLQLVNRFREIIKPNLEGTSSRLTNDQKLYLQKKNDVIAARIRSGELDTRSAEYDEEFHEGTVFVDPLPAKEPEAAAQGFWLQIIGTFAGLAVCYFSKFGIFNYLLGVPTQVDWIMTGVLIGGGAQPIHVVIKFLTDRKVADLKISHKPSVETEESKEQPAPAVVSRPEPLLAEIDIPYQGGIDRDKLNNVHLRQDNPSLIVYHHTAMHSDTTFADVVRVIKDKGWSTGYNCVILKDGGIHPFCRWDRYGNHAKGFNRQSLGVALNGNFEPNPNVPFSNVNGRMGLLRPTDAQLLSACKTVALWAHLYGIALDFEKSVIPHHAINPDKACPGSNFPYDQFKKLTESIFEQWQKSAHAQEQLAIFKQKQYLYA